MSALEEFKAGLKRFLGFRTPTPVPHVDEATQDRIAAALRAALAALI